MRPGGGRPGRGGGGRRPSSRARSRRGGGPRSSTPRPRPAGRAARRVRPHHRPRGGQAHQDGAGRGRAGGQHVPVRRRRGPHARRRDGAARRLGGGRGASSASRCACRSAWSARSARSTSRSTSWPTSWRPAIAAGCPVVLKPASQTPLSATRAGRSAARRVRAAARAAQRRHRRRRHGRQRPRRPPRRRHDHVHRFAAVGWGIRARAPRKKVGLELGNNAPVIIEPDADWKAAADKIKVAGFSHAGQSCISTQRGLRAPAIADDFTDGARRAGRSRWWSVTRSTSRPTSRR